MHTLINILNALYSVLDVVLGWTLHFGPFAALIIVGALTGFFANLFQKYCSDQKMLARAKADLTRLKELMKAAKQANDKDTVARLTGLTSRISSRYALGSLKPALFSIVPLCLIAMWTGSRMSYEPIRPGDEVEVVAHFEDGADGFAHIVPNESLNVVGAKIARASVPETSKDPSHADSRQANWHLKPASAGDHVLQVRYSGNDYKLELPVFERGGRAPEPVVSFAEQTSTHDQLVAVEVKLKDSVPKAWWNLMWQWMGVYVLAALASGLALRRVMGIS